MKSPQIVTLLTNPEDREFIKSSCESKNLVFTEFEELVAAEIDQIGKMRKAGLWDRFDDILDQIIIEEKG